MRALLLVFLTLTVALGAVLAGCSDDRQEQQQQQQQQQQLQADQADAPAQQQAASQQVSEAEQEIQAGEAEEADEPAQAQAKPAARAEDTDPLFAAARSAFDDWAADLESFEMAIDVDLNLGGLSTQVTTTVAVQLEPFLALATIDASSLFEVAAELGGDEQAGPDAPLLMSVLISEDAAYLSMPQIDGWIDLSDQFDETLGSLTAMIGASPENLTNPDQLGQAFGCVDAVGGSTAEGRHDGQAVWFVECVIDVDSLDDGAAQQLRATGIEVRGAGIDSMRLRLAISQTSGAPLLVESEARLRDAFGLSDGDSDDGQEDQSEFFVATTANLIAWNEPLEFPTPEPLVDGSLLQAFEDLDGTSGLERGDGVQDPPELLTSAQLLELASNWAANADELHVQFVAQAAIDGEARLASTIVRSSRIAGAFETTVNIDGERRFRLLWNRDGIWTSDAEEDGEPIWAPSSPSVLGFAELTVDEFLANPFRFNHRPLEALLDVSWAMRTITGAGPPEYELVIESGPLIPEDDRFEPIAQVLKADMAELLAESVAITSIDYYSTVITIVGDDGEVTGQVTTAEFQSSAGRVELVASLQVISDGPIEFSRPAE